MMPELSGIGWRCRARGRSDVAELKLGTVASATQGCLIGGSPDRTVNRFVFDTRELTASDSLFFALRGERTDGHDFLHELSRMPGCAAVVSADWKGKVAVPAVRVADPLEAARKLASHVRASATATRYAGITGSAGKTSAKEFLFQLLESRFRSYRSRGNWNNRIGLPFSLLNMAEGTEVAVFELAMSDPGRGEIHDLAEILRPDVAVILNALPVHLEFLGSVENVARAKIEIADFLCADDCLVLNGDDPFLDAALADRPGRVVRFGRKHDRNDVVMDSVERNNKGSVMKTVWWGKPARFHTNLIHHVHLDNLFAAMVAAHQLGVDHNEMQRVMDHIEPVNGRGVIRRLKHFTVVDETYNSNPEAVKRVLAWVAAEFSLPRVAVLGDMLELGPRELEFHREVGEFWAALDYAALIAIGPRAQAIFQAAVDAGADREHVVALPDAAAAADYLKSHFKDPCVLVLKASRGMGLERILEELSDD